MTFVKSYPFPERNCEIPDFKIFYIKSDSREQLKHYYEKNTSPESITISNQFFSIENMLIESFQYVLPVSSNSNASSVKFAAIIRESANLFEILCRKTYGMLFKYKSSYDLNIYNFLSLDKILFFSNEKLRAPILENYNPDKKIEPFHELINWDGKSILKDSNVPFWWKAYNKIKHDTNSIIEHATLNNALYSVAAIFILIRKIYGDGLISGFLRNPSTKTNDEIEMYQIRTSDIFIGEILKSKKIFK